MYKKIIEGLFLLGYFVLVAGDLLPAVDFVKTHSNLIVLIGFALIAPRIAIILLNKKNHTKKLLVLLGLLALSILTWVLTKNLTIFKFFVVVLAMLDVSYDKFFKRDFAVRLIVVALAMILYFAGVSESKDLIVTGRGVRYALGLWHPNYLGLQIMVLTIEFGYLFRSKFGGFKRIFLALIYVAAGLFIAFVPDSRTALIVLVIYTITSLFRGLFHKIFFNKIVKKIVVISFILFSALSGALVFLNGNDNISFLTRVNDISSQRLHYFSEAVDEKGVNPLGNKFEPTDHPLDNTYLRLLVEYGVIQYVIFMIMSVFAFRRFYKNKDDFPIEVLFIFGLYFITESSLSIVRNGLTYLLGEPFKDEKVVPKKLELKTKKKK